MRKVFAAIVLLCIASLFSLPLVANAYTTAPKSKAIHVVYDDSGSMIRDNNVYVDRWCQAKYAMEVFAAMLEDTDNMRVYYMSDFDVGAGGNVNASARVSLAGSDSAEARIAKVHDTVTGAANTSFDAVIKAYSDLKNETADEKWLVVLTDGEFNRLNGAADTNIDVDGYLSRFVGESDIKIIFLSMGEAAETITGDPGRNIYFEQANTSKDILGKITTICNRIFNRHELRFSNATRREFSFDVPMAELLVFAQGDNVTVTSISGTGEHTPDSTVHVNYSEKATTNNSYDAGQVKVARDLTGVVAAFKNIPKGNYSVVATGAQTVELYYKPDVSVDVKIYQNGEEVWSQNFVEGDYQIRYGLVDENGEFFESSLFGAVTYEAELVMGGEMRSIQSGDTFSLQRGDYAITVSAGFLDVNTVQNTVAGRVLPTATPLTIEITPPDEALTVSTLNNTGPFIMTILHEGQPLSQKNWLNMALPEVTTDADIVITGLKRGAAVSTFEFHIKQKDDDKFATATGEVKINVSAILEIPEDELICEGETECVVKIANDISFWDRLRDWLEKYGRAALTLLLVILFVLGYVPVFKKYLPRSLKKSPEIRGTPVTLSINNKPTTSKAKYTKEIIYSLLPYAAERGTIKFTGVSGVPSLKIRGAGRSMMFITNTRAYVGKKNIFFDGMPVESGGENKKIKPLCKGAGMEVLIKTKEKNYSCIPNIAG